jgi:hypothetical protein
LRKKESGAGGGWKPAPAPHLRRGSVPERYSPWNGVCVQQAACGRPCGLSYLRSVLPAIRPAPGGGIAAPAGCRICDPSRAGPTG